MFPSPRETVANERLLRLKLERPDVRPCSVFSVAINVPGEWLAAGIELSKIACLTIRV